MEGLVVVRAVTSSRRTAPCGKTDSRSIHTFEFICPWCLNMTNCSVKTLVLDAASSALALVSNGAKTLRSSSVYPPPDNHQV
jgi:hypothetical protein